MAVGCRPAPAESQAELASVRAVDAGMQLEFNLPVAIDRVTLFDEAGHSLLDLPLAGRRRTHEVPFPWRSGERYRVVCHLGGRVVTKAFAAPDARPPLTATLEAPLGQHDLRLGDADEWSVLVPADGTVSLGITIESRRQQPSQFQLTLRPSPGVEIASSDERLQADAQGRYAFGGEIELQHDYRQLIAELQVSPDAVRPTIEVRFGQTTAGEAFDEQRLTLHLRAATPAELAELVRPLGVVFPADPLGAPQPERLSDAVVLPNAVWSALRRLLQPTARTFDPHAPYAHQAVHLHNGSPLPLNLLIESEVVDPSQGVPLLQFAPPAWLAPHESPTAEHLLRIPPGESTAASIPLYVRPEAQPGRYQRRFRVSLLGSSQPLAEFSEPLHVLRGDPLVSWVVVVSIAASSVVWLVVALAGRRMIRALGNDGLAIIGTVASLHFVASYVARIGGDVLASVTGPFNIFIAGIGNEGVTCLLLATLIVLIPRPGTALFSSATVFLLNAMFTGQFGLVDVLFVSVSILCTETALALLGVTTGAALRRPAAAPPWHVILRVAAAIGMANAVTSYAQFCLLQVLLRLFFADWYIAAVALVTGLFYGGIGAALGTVLGYRLRKGAR